MTGYFELFYDKICSLPEHFQKEDLINSDFLLEREGAVEIYYSPHNEYVNKQAEVLIIGITPGWSQMERAMLLARKYIREGMPSQVLVKRVNQEVRFYGSMRKNLLGMLNELYLPDYLGLSEGDDFFDKGNERLHTTSLIRYPVFVNGKNYNGHNPNMHHSDIMMKYVNKTLEKDILPLKNALIIPLGLAVEKALHLFIEKGFLHTSQILFGFPHPSGANGHRFKQFSERKQGLANKTAAFFHSSEKGS